MRPVLTATEMRAVDAQLISAGVPGVVLMENAGRGAAHLIGLRDRPRGAPHTGSAPQARRLGGSCVRCADERALGGVAVAVVCGVGKNGGDGFVVARHLLARGAQVEAFLAEGDDRIEGDAAAMLAAFRAVGGRVHDARGLELSEHLAAFGIIVDAVLGTGTNRAPDGDIRRAIVAMNESGRPIVALDVPSGLDATTGRAPGVCVRAEHTVTFGFLKTGLLTTFGLSLGGRITLAHLGVPAALPGSVAPGAHLIEETDVRAALAPRNPALHKVLAGRVGVVGGSLGMGGAPQLTGRAALRAGAGLVTVVLPEEASWSDAGESAELMTKSSAVPWSPEAQKLLDSADALVVGPGIGRTEDARARVRAALATHRPTVLDADGLRAVEGDLGLLAAHPALVLTPHSGEAAGLLGVSAEAVENDRFAAARRLASETGAIVVLKGPRTLIAHPEGRVHISAFGTPALATGGSGDVLAGILGGLLAAKKALPGDAQSHLLDAAGLGAALHGLSAELWSESGGDAGMLASDLLDALPRLRARMLDSARASDPG